MEALIESVKRIKHYKSTIQDALNYRYTLRDLDHYYTILII